MEQWKPIEGYEGLYDISSHGHIRSYVLSDPPTKLAEAEMNTTGYLVICLHKNGIQKTYRIHRLVAKAFIDNPDDLPVVNHKDEDKHNNHVSNLEWCSIAYNNNYGTRLAKASRSNRGNPKRMGKNSGAHKAASVIDVFDKKSGDFLFTVKGTAEMLAKGLEPSSVSKCITGAMKSSHGMTYKERIPRGIHQANNSK